MPFLEAHNRLYHYCRLSTAINYILPTSRLLLNPIEKTNDPRENKNFVFKYCGRPVKTNSEKKILNSKYSRILRGDCKVLCFCQDTEGYLGCLLSRMWALYGDNHKGVCLELDKNKFVEENRKEYDFSLFRKIEYFKFDYSSIASNKKIDLLRLDSLGELKYLKDEFRKEHLDFLFFTKNSEWESESEVRLIHFSSNDNNEFCTIENSLTNIHLGINFRYSELNKIKRLINGRDIEIIGTDYGEYGLVFMHL
jgi:hypothetical protein